MRFSSIHANGSDTIALSRDGKLYDLRRGSPNIPSSLDQIFGNGEQASEALFAAAAAVREADLITAPVRYRPVLPRPGKLICIGRNYAAHAREGGAEPLAYPDVFMRVATSLLGHNEPLVRPVASDKFDYEGELAFVIGRRGRRIRAADALEFVFGYSLFNDGSLRDYQRKSTQWTMGKNFDATGAFGPEMVTADELPLGAVGLDITTRLNGTRMQHGNTADLLFPIDQLVEILSECMTLEPGDVVFTGTPSGVGYARNPPVFLKSGDRVEISVSGMAPLVNIVVDERPESSTVS